VGYPAQRLGASDIAFYLGERFYESESGVILRVIQSIVFGENTRELPIALEYGYVDLLLLLLT
jgi:hypothetical protein